MAMFNVNHDPNEIKCLCGSRLFTEVPTYLYSKVKDNLGEALERTLVSKKLNCSSCGRTVQDIAKDSLRILEKN